jgi:cobalt/nickel transport protein
MTHPLTLAAALILTATPGFAHYGMIIPSDSMIMQDDPRNIDVTVAFAHPFEREGMELVTPKAFRLYGPQGETDLLPTLTPAPFMGQPAFATQLTIREPGLHVLYLEPEPYWEPAEDAFIVHHTKTYLAAFGQEEGWSEPQGLITEIKPLSKPYGLWAGNLFQGQVLRDGAPVPGAEVEIEFYNQDGAVTAASDYMITQTVLADADGVFSYAAPGPGWWGFAALTTADYTLPHDDVEKPVELGAVVWVHFEAWP